ncbi:MAG: FtsQ-type POTRA domain-containing protein [Clostridiales Family XIII bacterium]|jgi:cell division protein FtsQ|nr:FtsQ-type POTRA domain-containing protein [Clostridiales Family XIII bacterium]
MEENEVKEIVPEKKKKKRRKKRYLLKLCVAALAILGAREFLNSSIFDIQRITVENNAYHTSEQIIAMAGVAAGENIFRVSMREVRNRLLADPYILSVKMKRALPGNLVLRVAERKEAAFVSDRGDCIVIDENGLVLRRTKTAPLLTELGNLNVVEGEAGRPLLAEENAAFTDTLNLLKKVKNAELYFKKVDISNIIIRAYIFDHLICEGTPAHLSENLDALRQRLLDLKAQGIERGTFKVGGDRYIAWQPASE